METEKSEKLKESTRMMIVTYAAMLMLITAAIATVAEILITTLATTKVAMIIVGIVVVGMVGIIFVIGTGFSIRIKQKEEETKEDKEKLTDKQFLDILKVLSMEDFDENDEQP